MRLTSGLSAANFLPITYMPDSVATPRDVGLAQGLALQPT